MRYLYGMRLRGYSPGCQPKDVLMRLEDVDGNYHDLLVYDRKLTAEEVRDYELDELSPEYLDQWKEQK